MVSLSGKGVNQLGLYESCNKDDGFEYALITAKIENVGIALVSLGVCGPKVCNTKENYYPIAEQITKTLNSFISVKLYPDVEFPAQLNDAPLSAGAWITI